MTPILLGMEVLEIVFYPDEVHPGDAIKGNVTFHTSNTGRIKQADNLVAISGKLFPHIAWGYMNSEHCALEKFTTTVDEIQDAQLTRERSPNGQFSKFSKQAEDLSKMMGTNFNAMCERMQGERDTLKQKPEEERKFILEREKFRGDSDQMQFKIAQLLWYETELESAEKEKSQLRRDLKRP